MEMKPDRGTFAHTQWMIQDIQVVADELHVPARALTREVYLSASTATRTDTDHYGWAKIRDLAAAAHRRTLGIGGPVDPEDLPFDAVPEDYYVHQNTSKLDKHGNLLNQSVQARIQKAPGHLTDQMPKGHIVKGVSTLVSGSGQTVQQWIKTGKAFESREQILTRLFRDLPEEIPARAGSIPTPGGEFEQDHLAVYPMGDPHIGMLSWAPETGDSFDLVIASRLMKSAMDTLVEGKGRPAEEALIINLGDFFHSDNADNRTNRGGNALDVDGRWTKVLNVGIELMEYTIDAALRRHKKVTVISSIGNHDDHTAIVLAVCLGRRYVNEPRVTIDTSPAAHHKFRFGKNLIGVTHGHQSKGPKLPLLMASKWPEDWGQTKNRFWYVGHIHHRDLKEYNGCVVEHFRTLAAKDAWHTAHGYGAGRDMNRITLHKEWGQIERHTVSADFLEAQYRASL